LKGEKDKTVLILASSYSQLQSTLLQRTRGRIFLKKFRTIFRQGQPWQKQIKTKAKFLHSVYKIVS